MEPTKYNFPITSAVGIVVKENKILLTKRSVEPFKEKWVMPGGKIDFGESIEDGVIREIKEEVGLDTKVKKLFSYKELLPSPKSKMRHYIILYFILEPISFDQKIKINPKEVEASQWVDGNTFKNYEITEKAKEILQEFYTRNVN